MIPDPGTILAAHRWREQNHGTIYGNAYCTCGWTAPNVNGRQNELAAHAAHQLAILAAAGIAVVVLPEPDGDDGNNMSWEYASMWHVQNTITAYPRRNHDYTPAEARSMAADLLAAASAAEKGTVR